MFSITVHFPLGTFQANSNEDLSETEWPPHPSRLFAGLVSIAETAADVAALEWLERLDPPTIVASGPQDVGVAARSNYVVTNVVDRKGRSHLSSPARAGSGRRDWLSVAPADDDVSYVWTTSDPVHLDALRQMCRRLPYLGRSTSPVVAWVDDDPSVDGDRAWVPDPDGGAVLSVPSPGFLEALELAFQNDQRSWSVSRAQRTYRAPGQAPPPEPDDNAIPFRDREWIAFAIDGRRRLPYSALVAFTDRFRSAAMAVLGDDAPPILHGHARNGAAPPAERVMFLGLPWVEHRNADGRILGFAVSIPKDHEDRGLIYRALVDIEQLAHPRLGKVRLTRRHVDGVWTLNPARWTRPSPQWVTAYPAVLDRYVRKPEQVTPIIEGMCERVGLPAPTGIDWSTSPLIPGPDRLLARHTVRRQDDHVRKFFHIRLRFAEPVAGPIVLGQMRHFGLGLMLPEEVDQPEAAT